MAWRRAAAGRRRGGFAGKGIWLSTLALTAAAAASCVTDPPPPPEDPLVARGRALFFTETFAGNGRTCATCHREEDNFGLSPELIATLPADDPLFVAETNPDLATGFENPRLMRAQGLILENLDGFDDLERVFVMRGVPHTLAMSTSVASRDGPHTGWSGDGAPGDGTLRSFATGAVIQHFTRKTTRIPGEDFRLPTEEELDALEAFMLSIGRQEDPALPLSLTSTVAARGQEIFLSSAEGKCSACHFNAGANADPAVFGEGAGNLNFDTGVEEAPGKPQDGSGELVPDDDGLGAPGDGTFNTPPLVEAADTGPFFHDSSVATLEDAVAFYNSEAFAESPSGRALIDATGSAIDLDDDEVFAVAAFLRVLNALENIRQADVYLREARAYAETAQGERGLRLAPEEIRDAVAVLEAGRLHDDATAKLRASLESLARGDATAIGDALADLADARAAIVREEL
jgi:cytochrome c peroxidase